MPRRLMPPRWRPSCALTGRRVWRSAARSGCSRGLQRRPACAVAANAQRLRLGDDGTLESLRWEEFAPAAPGPGQVRVRVVAAGINFRDVLLALRMYPGADAAPGAECAGVVEAVGEGVTGFESGDRVFGFAPDSLASVVVVPAAFLAPWPDRLGSLEVAAALPAAYLTAMYGLLRLADLEAGQRVLIHAAAGGVGMAAVQLCQRAGARSVRDGGLTGETCAVALAGRRARIRLAVDGVCRTHPRDHRGRGRRHRPEFAGRRFHPRQRRRARGAGLLPRTGQARRVDRRTVPRRSAPMRATSSTTSARRRTPNRVAPASAARRTARRLVCRLAAAAAGAGVRVRAGCRRVPPDGAGAPRGQAGAARAAHGRRRGGLGTAGARRRRPTGLPAASALSGCTPPVGWSVSAPRHIVLTGRRLPGEAARQVIRDCEALGASVLVRLADSGDAAQMRALFDEIVAHAAAAARHHPRRGHARRWRAAAAEPSDRFAGVLRGKAHGARILDALTRDIALDFFVLYSAAGTWLGPAGQAAYAAANAELDAIAHARRASGLPALSVAWGLWRDGGMASATAAAGHDAWSAPRPRMDHARRRAWRASSGCCARAPCRRWCCRSTGAASWAVCLPASMHRSSPRSARRRAPPPRRSRRRSARSAAVARAAGKPAAQRGAEAPRRAGAGRCSACNAATAIDPQRAVEGGRTGFADGGRAAQRADALDWRSRCRRRCCSTTRRSTR